MSQPISSEFVRVVQVPGESDFYVEQKLDCYGGTWQPIACSRGAMTHANCIAAAIEIAGFEASRRVVEEDEGIAFLRKRLETVEQWMNEQETRMMEAMERQ